MPRTIFGAAVISAVVWPGTAGAQEPPTMVPTRLDFEATNMPKGCQNREKFGAILANWVPDDVLAGKPERQLVVRIRRTPVGKKLAEVTLLGTADAPLAEDRKQYSAQAECHEVLYDTARAAARLMGAFVKPPPPAPVPIPEPACPVELPPPMPAAPPLAFLQFDPPAPKVMPPPPRISLGVGVLLGHDFLPALGLGPWVSVGFVPAPRVPRLTLHAEGAWLGPVTQPKSLAGWRTQAVPLFGSICYSPWVLRFCGGLATTFAHAQRVDDSSNNEGVRISMAATLRGGLELEVVKPFSIRIEGQGLIHFWERTWGNDLRGLGDRDMLAAAGHATAVWSFD